MRSNCSCPQSFYLDDNDNCRLCPVDYFCPGQDSVNVCQGQAEFARCQCPQSSTSYPGAISVDGCLCDTATKKAADGSGECVPCTGDDLCAPKVTVVETRVEIEISEDVDLAAIIEVDDLKEALIEVFDLPDWVRDDDVEVILRRVLANGEIEETTVPTARLLLASAEGRRVLLQQETGIAEWEVITRTVLGSADPEVVEDYIQQFESFVSDTTNFVQVLQDSANETIDTSEINVIEESLNFDLATSDVDTDCSGPGEVIDAQFSCVCQAGWTGNVGSGGCSVCPTGYYKDQDGGAACTKCGPNQVTDGEGATDVTACKCETGFTGGINDALGVIVCNEDAATTNIVILIVLVVVSVLLAASITYIVYGWVTGRGKDSVEIDAEALSSALGNIVLQRQPARTVGSTKKNAGATVLLAQQQPLAAPAQTLLAPAVPQVTPTVLTPIGISRDQYLHPQQPLPRAPTPSPRIPATLSAANMFTNSYPKTKAR